MIAVPAGRRHYRNAYGNKNIVYFKQNNKFRHPMSVIQNASTYPDQLDAGQFILKICLDWHKFLTSVDGRNMPTARRAQFRRWIHYEGRDAARIPCHGHEKDMPSVWM